jgi:hypothetical protein
MDLNILIENHMDNFPPEGEKTSVFPDSGLAVEYIIDTIKMGQFELFKESYDAYEQNSRFKHDKKK